MLTLVRKMERTRLLMNDNFDKVADRNNRALRDIPKVSVRNVDDIRMILAQLDPKRSLSSPKVEISALVNATEDGKVQTYKVDAVTKSKSMREMLIEGIEVVKSHIINDSCEEEIEINGKSMKAARIGDNLNAQSWVDPLIKQWLDGHREGTLICWDIDSYKYRYDIYEHKLDRIKKS